MKVPMAGVDAAKDIVFRQSERIRELEASLAELGRTSAKVHEFMKKLTNMHNQTAESVTTLLRVLGLGDHPREYSVAEALEKDIIPKVQEIVGAAQKPDR
jgi:hypothetical protein